MSRQFGVSRTVVREAVARLKSEGLLRSRQGAGVFVSQDAHVQPLRIAAVAGRSREAVLQIVELRRAIEAESAALAAVRRSSAMVVRMRKSLITLERAVARGGDGVAEDVQFHRLIAEASGNPHFLSVLTFLGQYLGQATRVTRANEARRADFTREVREEHQAVLTAIEAQDANAARRAAGRHMQNAARRIDDADASFWAQADASDVLPQTLEIAA
jgi:GntR family transcriptional regulator, transcriptional repressor for pyruvate dehydrogenase complex